jgi:hypothetical protein
MFGCMLSTIDNPFNPFEQFELWFMFDTEKGYNSCSRLARVAKIEDDFTPIEAEIENERAIDSIIENDFTGTYIKVRCKPVNAVPDSNT